MSEELETLIVNVGIVALIVWVFLLCALIVWVFLLYLDGDIV